MAVNAIDKLQFLSFIFYNFGDIWSSNPRDSEGTSCTYLDETAKIGISDEYLSNL